MHLKSFRSILFTSLGIVGWLGLPAVSRALPITRTLEISRPSLQSAAALSRERGGPVVLGPGGARRYAGVVVQSPPALLTTDPTLQLLSSATVFVNAPGCGTPTVSVSNDSVHITWPSECVDPGESVVVRFTSADSVTECGSGVWRDNSFATVAVATCQPWPAGPALEPRLLATLGAFLGMAGLVAMRRRNRAASRG